MICNIFIFVFHFLVFSLFYDGVISYIFKELIIFKKKKNNTELSPKFYNINHVFRDSWFRIVCLEQCHVREIFL